MTDLFRRLFNEPRVPNPPVRVWRDWVLFAAVVVSATLEVLLRTDDVVWKAGAFVMCLGLAGVLLFRRTHPLLMAGITLVVVNVSEVASLILNERRSFGLFSMVFLLIVVYSVFRWGSGRDARITLGLMFTVWIVGWFSVDNAVSDNVAGGIVFLFPALAGLEVRHFLRSREQQIERGRSQEREQLARELHDTVAHYVSAIAIQAQAGLAVADMQPEAAKEALRTVEEAASRTLIEMRSLVSALRNTDAPELAPQAGVHDIEHLAEQAAAGPSVHVELEGELDDLRPLLNTALYRLAQESITNALRHAKNASSVMVRVSGRPSEIELVVTDDGEPSSARSSHVQGFGLMGMSERAKLLGGTFVAGPDASQGWTTRAVLPRRAVGG